VITQGEPEANLETIIFSWKRLFRFAGSKAIELAPLLPLQGKKKDVLKQ